MYQQIATTLRVARRETPEVPALDLSLFFILSDDGLRVSELPMLTIGDWDPQARPCTSGMVRAARTSGARHCPHSASY